MLLPSENLEFTHFHKSISFFKKKIFFPLQTFDIFLIYPTEQSEKIFSLFPCSGNKFQFKINFKSYLAHIIQCFNTL